MRNNSTKQKGKKISTSHYRSKFRAQRYGDKLPKKLESLEEEKAVHASIVSEGFANFIPKEDRSANSCDVNPLETIWIEFASRSSFGIKLANLSDTMLA